MSIFLPQDYVVADQHVEFTHNGIECLVLRYNRRSGCHYFGYAAFDNQESDALKSYTNKYDINRISFRNKRLYYIRIVESKDDLMIQFSNSTKGMVDALLSFFNSDADGPVED